MSRHFDGDAWVRRSEVPSEGLLGCGPLSHLCRVGTTELDRPRFTLTQRARKPFLKSSEAGLARYPNDTELQIAHIAPPAS